MIKLRSFIRKIFTIRNYSLLKKSEKIFRHYKVSMDSSHLFFHFPVKIVPFQQIPSFEFFDYYSVFYYWVSDFLKDKDSLNILTLGGVKMGDAILSLKHNVTSIVLDDPLDRISKVRYIRHDVFYPLPFKNRTFDVFISPATLHLVGLGRYGDRLSPHTLFNFLNELRRVLRIGAEVFICIPLGKNVLIFNHHYIFEFDTILKIFNGFELVDYLVDEWAGVPGYASPTDLKALGMSISNKNYRHINKSRFTKNVDVSSLKLGEYKIIYLHFRFKSD
jgi:hypothetical protein